MTTNTQTRNNFDFNAYNALVRSAGAGLKITLIEQMLEDIEKTCRRFNNPLKGEVSDMLDEITTFKASWKKQAENSQKVSQVAAQVDAQAAGTTPPNANAPLSKA